MTQMIKAVRGTRDLLPPETGLWNHIETTARRVFARYNFGEIRTPIFEDTQLFARGVGEETDIVSKEMYTWEDKARAQSEKAQLLTLRPENTAGVVRAYIEHKLGEQGLLQKLYYIGPQFRRERPQKGRYRQFFQIGAEVIGPPSAGSESPLRDAEVLEMLATLLNELGITGWRLLLNSVGTPADRPRYIQTLKTALAPVVGQMCTDCQRRAETNPLRVLDCKHPEDQPIVATLPRIWDSLDDASRAHFQQVCEALDACGVPYEQDHRLVRGLDYYTRTTFEFQHGGLGAQNALLGGGRYDGLSEAIGGPRAPGIGFAIGEDRLVLTLQAQALEQRTERGPAIADAYIAPMGEAMNAKALELARELRAAGLRIELGDGSFRLKKSFEVADKLARRIVILGEDEAASGILTVKDFATGEQTKVPRAELRTHLRRNKGNALLDFLGTLERSHTCGQLRTQDAGQQVTLMGWVNRRRDHGNLIFLDLRDRTGVTQVVLDKDISPAGHAKAEQVRPEYVVAAKGTLRRRDAGALNPKMPTGEVELVADELLVLNDSRVPPFSPAEDAIANEELRLQYRYLDLRRPEMQANFALRHRVALAIRNYLAGQGFLEIETPFMTRSTPEGARDYLVPSRVHPAHFYALPQSPQLFKQILMISGFDRYFQIVRCFRDEDLRADRQPEFTQIDLEMTFPQQETIFKIVEGFLQAAFREAGTELAGGFPQMSFDEAIRLYGIDKPDMRLPAMVDVRSALSTATTAALKTTSELPVIAVRIPSVGELSRKERDELRLLYPQKLQMQKIKVLDDFKRLEKSFPEDMAKVRTAAGAAENDLLILVVADGEDVPVQQTVGKRLPARDRQLFEAAGLVRLALAQQFATRHRGFEKKGSAEDYKFLWVTDFPMFEWDEETKTWVAAHHPFTSPHEDDLKTGRLTSDPGAVRALAYDIVLNGTELGSGSIRIHQKAVQAEIFRALGMTDEEAKERFGFFLEALTYGTPPHGGIALGLDRIAMILSGSPSLREVIAFPKTAKAIDLMVDAPTPVSDTQLRELHIRPVLKE